MSQDRRKPGEPAPAFTLPAVGGERFDSRSLVGRHWLLSFQRYAT